MASTAGPEANGPAPILPHASSSQVNPLQALPEALHHRVAKFLTNTAKLNASILAHWAVRQYSHEITSLKLKNKASHPEAIYDDDALVSLLHRANQVAEIHFGDGMPLKGFVVALQGGA